MALLAVLDVEDLATPKIREVRNALDELGATTAEVAKHTSSATFFNTDTLNNQVAQIHSAQATLSQSVQQSGTSLEEAATRAEAAMSAMVQTTRASTETIAEGVEQIARAPEQVGQAVEKVIKQADGSTRALSDLIVGITDDIRIATGVLAEYEEKLESTKNAYTRDKSQAASNRFFQEQGYFTTQNLYTNPEDSSAPVLTEEQFTAHKQAIAAERAILEERVENQREILAEMLTDRQKYIAEAQQLDAQELQIQRDHAQLYEEEDRRRAEAIPNLYEEANAGLKQAEALRIQAGAWDILADTLKEGGTVTRTQQDAYRALSDEVQRGTQYSADFKQTVASMVGQFREGEQITKSYADYVRAVGKEFNEANGIVKTTGQTFNEMRQQAAMLQAALLALSAGAIYGLLKGSVELSARIETLNVVMSIAAKNAGYTSGQLQAQAKEVQKLGITTRESIESLLGLINANVRVADSSKLARAAQDLAVVAGKNSSQTLSMLINAIETQNLRILRQVGIVTSAEQVFHKYAASMGKTAAELTELERRQAIVNKILEEGAKFTGAYEASMGTASKMMGSMARHIEEIHRQLGDQLLPVYTLIVKAVYGFTEGLAKADPVVYKFVATILSAVAAVTALLGILAAGKFLAAMALFAGMTTGMGLLAAAVGAVVAGFVLWNNETKQTVGQIAESVSVLDEQTRVLEKEVATHERLSAEKQTALDKGRWLVQVDEDLTDSTNKLAAAVPSAITQFDALTNTYEINRGEVERVISANHRLRATLVDTAKSLIGPQRKAFEEAQKAHQENMRQLDEAKTKRAMLDTQLGRDQFAQGILTLRQPSESEITRWVDRRKATLDKEEKELAARVAASMKELNTLGAALKVSEDTIEQFGATIPQQIARVQEALTKGFAEWTEKARKLGVSLKVLNDPKLLGDPQLYREKLATLVAEVEKAEQKANQVRAAEAKKAENIQKQWTERLEQDSLKLRQNAQRLNTELAKAMKSGDEERYFHILRVGEKDLLELQGTAIAAGKGMDALRTGIKDVVDINLSGWAKDVNGELTGLEQALGGITAKYTEEVIKDTLTAQRERETLTQASNDRLYEMDRDLYERRTVAHMTEVDQAIYQERRRIDEMVRATEREIRDRDRVLAYRRKEVDERARMAKQEITDLIAAIEMKRNLRQREAQAELDAARFYREDPKKIQALEAEVNRIEMGTRLFKERAGVMREVYDAEIDLTHKAATATLNENARVNAEIAANQRAAVSDQIAQSKRVEQEIRASYALIAQSARMAFVGIVQTAASTATQILTGQMSLKDGLINIWRSIQKSISGIIDNIVDRWIKGALRMASEGGGFDVAKFFKGLMGREAATAAGSSLSSVGATAGTLASRGGYIEMAAPSAAGTATAGGSGLATFAGPAAGALVGAGVGYATKSKGWGAASGAATGAAVGAMFGGPVGAVVGGAVGLIGGALGGMFGQRKESKQVNDMRDEFFKAEGGLLALSKRAKEAGFNIEKLLTTHKIKDFQKEVEKLNKALELSALTKARENLIRTEGGIAQLMARAAEAGITLSEAFIRGTQTAEQLRSELEDIDKALELKKAKEGLARTFSQMVALRKQAELVGYDIRRMYDAKTIEEFNAEQARLNKLLEDQQLRLNGLATAAAGIQARTQGLALTVAKGVESIFKDLSDSTKKSLQEAYEAAQRSGFTGSLFQFARENAEKFGLSLEKIAKLGEETGKSVGRIAQYIGATFGGILRETGDFAAAFAAISPSLEILEQVLKDTGVEASGTLKWLLDFKKVVKDNEDVATSLGGIQQILSGLADSGRLTAEMFNTLGADTAAQWDIMKSRGVETDKALMLMQPTLQTLYEAQKNFGFATDEATQKLIDMGIENGIVGDQFQSVNQKMLDILVLIAEVLGADIPEAYRRVKDSAKDAGGEGTKTAQDVADALEDQERQTKAAYDAWRDFERELNKSDTDPIDDMATAVDHVADRVENAERVLKQFGRTSDEVFGRAEDDATGTAEGHSPGGIKEISNRLREAIDALRIFRDAGREHFRDVEDSADAVASTLKKIKTPQTFEEGDPFTNDSRERKPSWRAPGEATPAEPQPTIQVILQPEFKIDTIDASGMDQAVRTKIGPAIISQMRGNTDQMAVEIGEAINRYAAKRAVNR